MSAKNNYVSETMFNTRITAHGKVESLEHSFILKDEHPFSLYIRPKSAATAKQDELVTLRLYKEDEASPMPVTLQGWQEFMAVEVVADDANKALLEKYEMYWGAGTSSVPMTAEQVADMQSETNE